MYMQYNVPVYSFEMYRKFTEVKGKMLSIHEGCKGNGEEEGREK